MREQVPQRDRLSAWDQPGEPALDRVVQPQLVVLDEPKHECRDEGLRDAADTKSLVGAHPDRSAAVREATRLGVHHSVFAHDDEHPGCAGGESAVEQRPQLGLVATRRDRAADEDERRNHQDENYG